MYLLHRQKEIWALKLHFVCLHLSPAPLFLADGGVGVENQRVEKFKNISAQLQVPLPSYLENMVPGYKRKI